MPLAFFANMVKNIFMRLKDFLDNRQINFSVFAKSIGVTPETVRRYVEGHRIPHMDIMAKIQSATDGQVSPNDFYEVSVDVSVPPSRSLIDVPAQSLRDDLEQGCKRTGGGVDVSPSHALPVAMIFFHAWQVRHECPFFFHGRACALFFP